MKRRTKILLFLFFSLLLLGGFFSFEKCWAAENNIVINEIQISGGSGKTSEDYIELYNPASEPLKIGGWKIRKRTQSGTESSIKVFSDSAVIPAQGYFLWANIGMTATLKADEKTTATLAANNSVALFDDKGAIIDQVAWGTGHIEPFVENVALNVSGFIKNLPEIIERQNFQDTDDNSVDFKIISSGSPTSSGCLAKPELCIISPKPAANLSSTIFLSEIFPNPDLKNKQYSEEYIEIYNNGETPLNLENWELRDATKNGKYVFSSKDIITAKEYLVIYKNTYKFALNNSGREKISLIDSEGKEVSTLEYTGSKKDLSYSFDGTAWQWTRFLTPGEANKFEKKPKIQIVKIKPNPKGKDTDKKKGEEIYLKNNSKKKVNLKDWSLATGNKKLVNHPITKNFIIQPGKTKKITRQYSLLTLSNKKGAVELRYPDGTVADTVKYNKKKETIKDDEVYELLGKKWQWSASTEELLEKEIVSLENTLNSTEKSENINQEPEVEISEEEIALNLGKYSAENKLALVKNGFTLTKKPLLQSRETSGIILGAFSIHNEIRRPVEIKSINSWQKTLQKSNQFFNFLINQVVSLI